MIKLYIKNKNTVVALTTSAVLGFLYPLFSLSVSLKTQDDIIFALISARERAIFPEHFTPEIIIVIIPIAVMAVFLSSIFTTDFDIITSYVIIRNKNLHKWYCSATAALGILSFMCSLFYNTFILLISFVLGYKIINISAFITCFTYSLISIFLIIFLVSLFANILSLKIGVKNSVLISTLLFSLSGAMSIVLPTKITKYFWISAYFIQWHNPNFPLLLYRNGGMVNNGFEDISFLFSICYLLVLLLIEFAIGYMFTKKVDLI